MYFTALKNNVKYMFRALTNIYNNLIYALIYYLLSIEHLYVLCIII